LANRRQFLRQAATLAGGIVAAPYVVTSTALGAEGRPPASERIVMAHVGMGWFGTVDLKIFLAAGEVQNVAVCDVDASARDAAKGLADAHYGNQDCKPYHDFREMLDRDDIDAVSIATPDHWHAIPTIWAARRGKDIHVEKPLSLTIRQGRAMVDAVREFGRVCQVGSEGRSNARCRLGCELVRNGRIGEVKEVYVSGVGGPSSPHTLPAEPVPPELDWDRWLGPAPWRPYNKAYHPRSWRGYYDFSGGGLTDWGAHHFDLAQWALGMDDSGPVEIDPPDGKDRKWLTYKYANGVLMYHVLADFKQVPPMLDHVTIVGTKGRVGLSYGGLSKTDPPSLVDDKIGPGEIHLHECPPGGHERGDFLQSIRTREKPGADIEIGHRTVTVCHLGHIAYLLRRPLKWDPVKEEFVGDDEANRLCSRAMREPWRL
jgi:predicted dehydrogenase